MATNNSRKNKLRDSDVDVVTIRVPAEPKADFDLPGRPPTDRERFNEIADRWRNAYCGNLLRVEPDQADGSNWLLYDGFDHYITTEHVHASDYDCEAITQFVINAPEDMKWLLQLVLDFYEAGQPD